MKPSVLLAEGDRELCDVYRAFLLQCGYEVETAHDALECLSTLRRTSPAVLVLDMDLRWGGGDGILAWLSEQRGCSPASVVLTGLSPSLETYHQPLGTPVVHFLRKPFHLAKLFDYVRSATEAVRALAGAEPPPVAPVPNVTGRRVLRCCSKLPPDAPTTQPKPCCPLSTPR